MLHQYLFRNACYDSKSYWPQSGGTETSASLLKFKLVSWWMLLAILFIILIHNALHKHQTNFLWSS